MTILALHWKKSRNTESDNIELHNENQFIISVNTSNYPRQPKRKSPSKIIDLSDTIIQNMLVDDDKSFSSIEESDCGSEWKSSDENEENCSFEVDSESSIVDY